MKPGIKWRLSFFLQALLLSVRLVSSSRIRGQAFLGQEIKQASKQRGKVKPVHDNHSSIMGLLAAEAQAAAKARSLVAAEVSMEAQAAAGAQAAAQVRIAAEAQATAKAVAAAQDRIAAEAEAASHAQEQMAAMQAAGRVQAAAVAREAMSAHAEAERRSAQAARATAAEWAVEEARAQAEKEVITFARRAAVAHREAMRSGSGAAKVRSTKTLHAHQHHSSASEVEVEARLHGLRAAEEAAVTAHSRNLALKLELQVVDLENVEEKLQEEKKEGSFVSHLSPTEDKKSGLPLPPPEEIGWWEWSVHARLNELKRERRDAVSLGDTAEVKDIEQQIEALDQAMKLPTRPVGHSRSLVPHSPPHMQHVKMCSLNQRLCKEDALALYRLGHVVGALLDRHQIVWWATGGTLLGAVRNKGIIPHDDDMDYNILNEQSDVLLSRTFINSLTKNNLTMHRVEEGFWQIRPLHPNGGELLHVDIFAMWRNSYTCDRTNVLCYPHQWWHKHTFPASLCASDSDSPATDQKTSSSVHCPLLRRWPFGKSGFVWGPPEDMAKTYLNHVYGPDWQKVARCQDTNHPCGLIQNATHDATEALEQSGPLIEPLS